MYINSIILNCIQMGIFIKKRVIIQLESLLKLRIDGDPIPAYDLIIMDESESLLNQFNSTQTFKNLNKEAFDFLVEIINNSKKLVCLDGDLENRTYDYIKQFGESINIKNISKYDSENFIIENDKSVYLNDIYNNLNDNKKNSYCMPVAKICC